MSTTILTELELNSIATKTKIQEESETNKEVLRIGCFYWINAGYPKELDRSKDEYTKSPLRSFCTLALSGPLFERKLLRVSTNTTIWHKKIKGSKKRGKNPLNYKRPCYLAEYDKSTNQGVIFLGTSKVPDNLHRFVIVQSRSTKRPSLSPGSLGTVPPYSFREEKTYLNISHPLRVQFAYLPNGRFPHTKDEGVLYNGHQPPLVAIAKIATQPSDDGRETFVTFDKKSEELLWKKHMEYHRNRPGQFGLEDSSGGDGPDDDGPSTSGGGPTTGGGGSSTSGGGSSTSGGGSSTSGGGPSTGGGGPSISDGGPSTSGGGSNKCVFSSCKAEDAPWGRVEDQRIGIDIPLVIEDIYSDSDEEMDLEEGANNYDATDAPWGRVGDQRIGIDIPLVIEDIYSNPDEEMDSYSSEEFQEVDDVANVDKPESSHQKGITTWSNPSDKDSSGSYTIYRPYFIILEPFRLEYVLLNYDRSVGEWRWTKDHFMNISQTISIEGLSYESPILSNIERSESTGRIFNWHTKESNVLPPRPDDFNSNIMIVGMIVDTSMQPYAFKVIEGRERGTIIYDSMTCSWTHRKSVPPLLNRYRFDGHANVASCKGIVFALDNHNQIVTYDMEKDKWGCVQGPTELMSSEQLHGIGSWDDRIFSSIHCMLQYGKPFEIWELVSIANWEWKKFDAMPGEMYSWLTHSGANDLIIEVSYCSEYLLIWTWCSPLNQRFVLCNLACKKWEKLELPFPTSMVPIPFPTSMGLTPFLNPWSDMFMDKGEDNLYPKHQETS